jgi:anti-sigma28 factor (negative regulator of flagellin synthesis)
LPKTNAVVVFVTRASWRIWFNRRRAQVDDTGAEKFRAREVDSQLTWNAAPTENEVSLSGRDHMQVYGPTHLHGPQTIHSPHAVRSPAASGASPAFSICDELQISDAGRLSEQVEALVDQAKQLPDVRLDRVSALRAQIASGSYETTGKLSMAVDRLLDEIG